MRRTSLAIAIALAVNAPPATAQHDAHAGHDTGALHSGHDTTPTMDHGGHAVEPEPPAEVRDPNAYAEGYAFRADPRLHLGDKHALGGLFVDRLEAVDSGEAHFWVYDLRAWYGKDYDRALLKAEGDVDNRRVEDATTELLWSHAVTPFWNRQLGVRYDSGEGPSRSWLALGFDGLAPYWFEVDGSFYLGEQGRTALTVEAEYELLFTQRLILQPRAEVQVYGKDDPERARGSGFSDAAIGLRLRYEFLREFAPYVGVDWAAKFGGTAAYVREAGGDAKETRAVAGLRFWF